MGVTGAQSGGTAGQSGPGLGAAQFADGELDPPSDGGTITMQEIGGPGWYPSVRDPASGMCDGYNANGCRTAKHSLTGDKLSTKFTHSALRRPSKGYRYFVVLMAADQRTIQLAVVHPQKIPAGFGGFLPSFLFDVPASAISAALGVRLPK